MNTIPFSPNSRTNADENATQTDADKSIVSFDEFKRLHLKIGTIISAERVEGSEKLLRLEVDFGQHVIPSPARGEGEGGVGVSLPQTSFLKGTKNERIIRQIIAGIGKAHTPERLIGTQCAFIVNLEPRKLMGLESQGMLLAASNVDGFPVLLRPEKDVVPGTSIQ